MIVAVLIGVEIVTPAACKCLICSNAGREQSIKNLRLESLRTADCDQHILRFLNVHRLELQLRAYADELENSRAASVVD